MVLLTKLMREILFRAKRVDNEEWAYGYYSPDMLEKTHGDSVDWAFIKEQRHEEVTVVTHYVKKATVGQFTGLLDKNGRKIFEGDIVIQPGTKWFDHGYPDYMRGVIKWRYSQWQVTAHCVNPNKRGTADASNDELSCALNDNYFEDGEKTEWEIMGNVHDNPNLFKKDYLPISCYECGELMHKNYVVTWGNLVLCQNCYFKRMWELTIKDVI